MKIDKKLADLLVCAIKYGEYEPGERGEKMAEKAMISAMAKYLGCTVKEAKETFAQLY